MDDEQRDLLRFEEQWPVNDRAKEARIRTTFGCSWVRYRQRLLHLCAMPAARAEFPALVSRIQDQVRLGQRRRADRAFVTPGTD
ncbi:DUF3263 domain-containing protein [Microbacterium sp. M1A1_1b]